MVRHVGLSGCPWPGAVRKTWTSWSRGKKKDKTPEKGGNRTREGQSETRGGEGFVSMWKKLHHIVDVNGWRAQ